VVEGQYAAAAAAAADTDHFVLVASVAVVVLDVAETARSAVDVVRMVEIRKLGEVVHNEEGLEEASLELEVLGFAMAVADAAAMASSEAVV
jgi:hypothetical protein